MEEEEGEEEHGPAGLAFGPAPPDASAAERDLIFKAAQYAGFAVALVNGERVEEGPPDPEKLARVGVDVTPDLQGEFAELSLSANGLSETKAMWLRVCESLRLASMSVEFVERDGPLRARVGYVVEGSNIFAGMPLVHSFTGRRGKAHIESIFQLDATGKVKSFSYHICIRAEPMLDPSCLPVLAECSLALSSTSSGSKLLQDALVAASPSQHEVLLHLFKGRVWDLSGSEYGHHVLQKYIVHVPAERVRFILLELQGRACEAARHRLRCRILERLLEHCDTEQTAGLTEELMSEAVHLSRHPFGNYVIQGLLEQGTNEHRRRLARVLCLDAPRLARHRFASNVVSRALARCALEDAQMLVTALAGNKQDLESLMNHCYGSFVIRELRHNIKFGGLALTRPAGR